jgi:hypothetical protein
VSRQTIYRRNESFVHRTVGEKEILVPVRRSGGDLSSIYLLNAVGSVIWNRLSEACNREDLVSQIVGEFDVENKVAEAELMEFSC